MISREWRHPRDPPQLEEDALPRSSESGTRSDTLHYSTPFDLRRQKRYGRMTHDCQSRYIQLSTIFTWQPVVTAQWTTGGGESFFAAVPRRTDPTPPGGLRTRPDASVPQRAAGRAHNAAIATRTERGRAARRDGPPPSRAARHPPQMVGSAHRRRRRPSSSTPVVAAVATPNPRCWASDCRWLVTG